jgi:hypothetical protein
MPEGKRNREGSILGTNRKLSTDQSYECGAVRRFGECRTNRRRKTSSVSRSVQMLFAERSRSVYTLHCRPATISVAVRFIRDSSDLLARSRA